MTQVLGLPRLEERIRQDLAQLCLPARPWIPAKEFNGKPIHDVIVIGGGMAGLVLGAALKNLGIDAHLLDKSPAGFEGPWLTTARMETLRSPKELTGPALGIGSLTFQAWFVAQWGLEAWKVIDKIPRPQWAEYLRWYRKVLGIEVQNGHEVISVNPGPDQIVRVEVKDHNTHPATTYSLLARRVVLATGRDGLGGPWVPTWAKAIPKDRWVHSSDVWEGTRFKGQRVVVIGGGSSSMDSAATALESGAARLDMLIRRQEFPRINKSKGLGSPGIVHGYWHLPDTWKWKFRHYINAQQVPPPRGSTLRVSRHKNAYFHFGAPVVRAISKEDGSIQLETPKGSLLTDQIIFSTGFRTDWALRPEFSSFAPHIRIWRDRFDAPDTLEDEELSDSPDLGSCFEFQPKTPDACPGLDRIHCFNYAATLSHGACSGDIPQISDGAQRLAQGLAAKFMAEDIDHHFEALKKYDDPELLGDEWTAADFPKSNV